MVAHSVGIIVAVHEVGVARKLVDAVVTEDSTNFVYVVDENNKVSKREITVGRFSDDNYELLTGVEQGERVVDNPKTSMAEGDKIAIKK